VRHASWQPHGLIRRDHKRSLIRSNSQHTADGVDELMPVMSVLGKMVAGWNSLHAHGDGTRRRSIRRRSND
jgi:hypothetical protein